MLSDPGRSLQKREDRRKEKTKELRREEKCRGVCKQSFCQAGEFQKRCDISNVRASEILKLISNLIRPQ